MGRHKGLARRTAPGLVQGLPDAAGAGLGCTRPAPAGVRACGRPAFSSILTAFFLAVRSGLSHAMCYWTLARSIAS